MIKIKPLFLVPLLPFLLTACATETCVRPVKFQLFSNEEMGVEIPVEIKRVETDLTLRKINADADATLAMSRIAMKLDDIVYKNCKLAGEMTQADKRKLMADNAKYDAMLDGLLIALRSPADEFKDRLQDWVARSKEVVEH